MMREPTIEQMAGQRFDVAVVGGGINGAVSAAALAGRGASVALVDRGDFASVTSQSSSNLVWGGIKYLQSYELPLVWALCASRNKLLEAYPTRIKEVPFLAAIGETTPFSVGMAALGAGAYWTLGRWRTAAPRVYSRRAAKALEPLLTTDTLRGAVRYSDAVLVDNDARFVWDFVRYARARGAAAVNYVAMSGAERAAAGWRLHLHDVIGGGRFSIDADIVINAAGPFAPSVSSDLGVANRSHIVLSKGAHLVVPRVSAEERVLAFFDDDGRLFYVIPMHDRSVIGTTDTRLPAFGSEVSDDDRRFILDQANRRLALARPITPDDIVAERCGVRSLVVPDSEAVGAADWMALSRRHEVEVDAQRRVLTILGGKLTDCLNVGHEVSKAVRGLGLALGPPHRWYGEEDPRLRAQLATKLTQGPALEHPTALLESLWRRQGSKAFAVVDEWQRDPANTDVLFEGTDITRGEFGLMLKTEMIVTLEDLFRRRTPLSQIRSREELAEHPGTAELTSALAEQRHAALPPPTRPRPFPATSSEAGAQR